MNNVTLLVMAAGMGSRYGGLKQLDAVGPNGETIIDYSVYDAIEAGFNKVVFIIRRDFESEFKSTITDKYSGKIEVEFASKICMISRMDLSVLTVEKSPGEPVTLFYLLMG